MTFTSEELRQLKAPISSHIQMPKMVMKRFADEKQSLYYIDCKTNKIKMGRAKTLYTEEDYYSERMENWLNSEIETKASKLLGFLENAKFVSTEEIKFDYSDYAYRYLYSLLSRSPDLVKTVINEHAYFRFFGENAQHDIAVSDTYALLKRNKFLQKETQVSFIDNHTEEQFVLPTGGMTKVKRGIICPLSPKRAVLFDYKELSNGIINVIDVDDPGTIKNINVSLYRFEKRNACNYVIASHKRFLQDILERIAQEAN